MLEQFARNRVAFSLLPVFYIKCLTQFTGGIVQEWYRYDISFHTQGSLCDFGEGFCDTLVDFPVLLLPCRVSCLVNGWMNGCMSEVFEVSFAWVAVGNTMSEYTQVEDIRKSRVVTRSSLPIGASSTHSTSVGWDHPLCPNLRSLHHFECPGSTQACTRDLYLRNRAGLTAKQTDFMGSFPGYPGLLEANLISPDFNFWTTYSLGSKPAAFGIPGDFATGSYSAGARKATSPFALRARSNQSCAQGKRLCLPKGDSTSLHSVFMSPWLVCM